MAMLAIVLVAGCSFESTYFPAIGIRNTASVAEPVVVYLGIDTVEAHQGDTIELLGLDLLDTAGAPDVEVLAGRIPSGGSFVGAMDAGTVEAAGFDLRPYVPINGFRFSSEDGEIGILARVAPVSRTDPVAGYGRVRLHFRINGGHPIAQVLGVGGYVCLVGATPDPAAAPTPCEPGGA